MSEDDALRFSALFQRYGPRVFSYCRSRSDRSIAEDAVADTFLTAWRLRDDIPDDPLPWLLVLARHALANRLRSLRRSDRLRAALAGIERLATDHPAAEDVVVDRSTLLHAVAQLTPGERDAVLLIAWDGLTQQDAARVAGCSLRTFTARLGRARRRLDRAMYPQPGRTIERPSALPAEEPS